MLSYVTMSRLALNFLIESLLRLAKKLTRETDILNVKHAIEIPNFDINGQRDLNWRLSYDNYSTKCQVHFYFFVACNRNFINGTCASGTKQFNAGLGAVMPVGCVGNRRSDVALAIRHRLQWFIHLYTGSQPKKGRWSHRLHSSWGMTYFYL